jgi:hypothetical protein
MKLDEHLFMRAIQPLSEAGVGEVGLASAEFAKWIESLYMLPSDLVAFLKKHAPKTNLYAGAGSIYDQNTIMRENTANSRFLEAGLFILGCAPNGDFIVLDLKEYPGAVGYVSHDRMDFGYEPRSVFARVCDSIGEFMSRINADDSDLPDDYYEAMGID